MRKLAVGIIILALILISSLTLLSCFENDVESLCEMVESAYSEADSGLYDTAAADINTALEYWLDIKYTKLILHSSKIEGITAAFYDYLSAIETENENGSAIKEKLIYQLESTLDQEKLSPDSIF